MEADMTPQERRQVEDLFDRVARLETAPRDPEAERAIAEGLARAPNALYALVQTVLVQDEALQRADARIRALTGEEDAEAEGGFLGSMRSMLSGQPARTSVPSVRPGAASEDDPRWGGAAATPMRGGSFLGTAAASAAGVVGGALLLNSIGSLFGSHGSGAQAATSPWDQGNADSDLARQAGADDIGAQDSDPDAGDDFGADFGDFGGDGDI
jgi:hypothetical protein